MNTTLLKFIEKFYNAKGCGEGHEKGSEKNYIKWKQSIPWKDDESCTRIECINQEIVDSVTVNDIKLFRIILNSIFNSKNRTPSLLPCIVFELRRLFYYI